MARHRALPRPRRASKYIAALTALGLAAFVLMDPSRRRWLAHPAPYAALALALAIVSPVLVWNATHDWASFRFQGLRGGAAREMEARQGPAMRLGEAAYLTPWIFAGLVGALAAAFRRLDERRLFLLCLALPTIIVFNLTPIWGDRGLPHWAMPGWLFVFPLMGAWLAEPWASRLRLERWAWGTVAAVGAFAVLAASHAATGWIAPLRAARDPTLEMLPWTPLAAAPELKSAAFVVATDWPEASKIALALGPDTPVFVFSDDPRGWAAFDDSRGFVGKDAVIVASRGLLVQARALADSAERKSVAAPAAFADDACAHGCAPSTPLMVLPGNSARIRR